MVNLSWFHFFYKCPMNFTRCLFKELQYNSINFVSKLNQTVFLIPWCIQGSYKSLKIFKTLNNICFKKIIENIEKYIVFMLNLENLEKHSNFLKLNKVQNLNIQYKLTWKKPWNHKIFTYSGLLTLQFKVHFFLKWFSINL